MAGFAQKANDEITSYKVSNNPDSSGGKTSAIKIESTIHDFQKIEEGEIVTYSFKFKNIGNEPLIIMNAKASCGCTVPRYSEKALEPGASGFIDVTFNSDDKKGHIEKTISVEANTNPKITTLVIKADIHKN